VQSKKRGNVRKGLAARVQAVAHARRAPILTYIRLHPPLLLHFDIRNARHTVCISQHVGCWWPERAANHVEGHVRPGSITHKVEPLMVEGNSGQARFRSPTPNSLLFPGEWGGRQAAQGLCIFSSRLPFARKASDRFRGISAGRVPPQPRPGSFIFSLRGRFACDGRAPTGLVFCYSI